ncbi:DUF3352 domain-containing protein [Pseudanabaena mucicola]|uniref:DUF3352 domain-containing protein n=1 Tax=Pseudanabaena mucicola FACHB-723 TaxID=2692860 RepID=A0ABR7ZU30_9CYAN|nr:DUF3352 domain-containing protein [Pseudanabaena mucicola]MBD2187297.1 DUF3352 domain-containing protein [Pseudanabaena mucicola FACHB-723]
MTETKPNLLPIIGGAAVVVAGGIGAYFFFNKTVTAPTASTAGTLTVVPQQSVMSISLSTDGEALAKLEQFLSPETKKIYDQALAEFKKGLSSSDFDYEKDVKPWIGKNVSIAILPKDRATSAAPRQLKSAAPRYVPMSDTGSIQFVQDKPTSEAPPNILLVLEVKDKAGAEKFLTEKVKAKSGGKEKQSDYKGVKITQYGEGDKASASAMVGNYLVISPYEQVTQKAIDTFSGGPSLATSASKDDLKLQNSVAQVYIPNFGESIVELAALSPEAETIPPESLAQLKKVKSLNMGFGIDDVGIRFKAISKFDPNAIAGFTNSPNKVLGQVPSQAFSVISGFNIKNSWEQFVKSADSSPELKEGIEEVRKQLKSSPLAIDLDKDIFGWMDGEFAIASVSSKPEGILAQTQGLAPLILLQTTNRAAGESLLAKLDDFASKNGAQVAKKDVSGVSVTEWSAPGAGAIVAHGWSQQDTLFFTAAPIVSLFVPKPASALDADANFKSIVSTLPTTNVGYFYIDVDKTWSIFQGFLPPSEVDAETKAVIQSIKGLAGTAAYPNPETSELEFVLALKKGGK